MEKKSLKQTVKETIDFVYELLTTNPGGYELKPKTLGFNASRVCSTLVKRGIISKDVLSTSGKPGHTCIYKWIANMPPTKVLYGSVTDEIKHQQSVSKKKATQKNDVVVCQNDNSDSSLERFTSQELWDELKRRGATIKDGKIVIVVVTENELS